MNGYRDKNKKLSETRSYASVGKHNSIVQEKQEVRSILERMRSTVVQRQDNANSDNIERISAPVLLGTYEKKLMVHASSRLHVARSRHKFDLFFTAYMTEIETLIYQIETRTLEHYSGTASAFCTALNLQTFDPEEATKSFRKLLGQYYGDSRRRKAINISKDYRARLKRRKEDALQSLYVLSTSISNISQSPSYISRSAPPIKVKSAITRLGVQLNRPVPTVPKVAVRNAKGTKFRVFYGTNRKPEIEFGDIVNYTCEYDDELHYGSCDVFIPNDHVMGKKQKSMMQLIWEAVTFQSEQGKFSFDILYQMADKDAFFKSINEILGTSENGGDALIYIHGYNTSFQDAAIVAARLGFDLKLEGITAFFSWPSHNAVIDYAADASAMEASELAITNFIQSVYDESDAKKVHIIAHSMGNRGLLRAIEMLHHKKMVKFGQLILVAPDVNREKFIQTAEKYDDLSERTTLYQSAEDGAVKISKLIHKDNRLGFVPPITVSEYIDTIVVDQKNTKILFELGHSYHTVLPEVLYDMDALVRDNKEPDKRLNIKPYKTAGNTYWRLRSQ